MEPVTNILELSVGDYVSGLECVGSRIYRPVIGWVKSCVTVQGITYLNIAADDEYGGNRIAMISPMWGTINILPRIT